MYKCAYCNLYININFRIKYFTKDVKAAMSRTKRTIGKTNDDQRSMEEPKEKYSRKEVIGGFNYLIN